MPRRKQPFIDRSRASTFRLIQSSSAEDPNSSVPQLVALHPDDHADPTTANTPVADTTGHIDALHCDAKYLRRDYEYGEFGFPDDGYDYSKHFKPIGGGGGVFMDAITGLEKPQAVEGSIAFQEEREGQRTVEGGWKRKEDVIREREALKQIQKDRKWNEDLNEVLAALNIEAELEGGLETRLFEEGEGEEEESEDLLEDDFITLAERENEEYDDSIGEEECTAERKDGVKEQNKLEGVVETYREPRLLDEQFEKFMRAQEWASGDEDDDDSFEYFPNETSEGVDMLEDLKAHMTAEEAGGLWEGDGGLLDDLAKLQIQMKEQVAEGKADEYAVKSEQGDLEKEYAPGLTDDAGAISAVNVARDDERAAEFEKFAKAEFERGMEGLLDSYNRVTAEEAFDAFDGIDKVWRAVERGEHEEAEKREQRIDLGLDEESDGHDSELDSHLDELFREKEDRWDCETILSTYSNLENHPSVIDAPVNRRKRSVQSQSIIRLDPRTQAPAEYMPAAEKSSSRATAVDFGSRRRVVQETQARRRKESKEDKKARKNAVKEAARERRALKSEMKKAFGLEHVKQGKHATAMGTSKVAIQF